MTVVMVMFRKMRRSIEEMPRPAYIFLRALLALSSLLLTLSCLLFALGSSVTARNLAVLWLECPAGVLLLGAVFLGFLLDRAK